MKKLLTTLGLATVGGALAFGAAAYMPVSSDNLGSGWDAVEACDTDGVHVSYDLLEGEPQLVAGLTISDIDEACEGQTLSWVLQTEESVVITTGEGEVTGSESSFDLDFDVIAQEIGEVGITIAGAPLD